MSRGKCIDIKELFGNRYRIVFDEAVVSWTSDPWYYQIPCLFGHIYPHSSDLLGFFCTGPVVMRRLHRQHPDLEWTECDGEGIFYFNLDQFDMVAGYAKPRKRRKLSSEHKRKLAESNMRFRFTRKPGLSRGSNFNDLREGGT